ncbi:MAG: hypothetical protein LUB59_03825 [Candidatus Gastranaerophilales bacterium]|nr:hypothetical protein [Candidatus Gastranaerophilales bacterium]
MYKTPSIGDICKQNRGVWTDDALFLVVHVQENIETALVVPVVEEECSGVRIIKINHRQYYARLSWPMEFPIEALTIIPEMKVDGEEYLNPIRYYLRKKIAEMQKREAPKPELAPISRNARIQKEWEDAKTAKDEYLTRKVSLGSICTLKDARKLDSYLSKAKYFIPVYRVPNKMVRIIAVMDAQCPGESVIISGKEYWAIADIYYTITPDALQIVPKMKLKARDETVARLCAVQHRPAPVQPKEIPQRIKASPKFQFSEPPQPEPNNTLYVYKGLIVCFRHHHPITQVTTIVKDDSGEEWKIDLEYCYYCKRKMLSYSAYEYYRNILGPLANDIRMLGSGFYDWEYSSWSEESVLHQLGYNVSQRDALSARTRRSILAHAIYDGIMTKTEVLHFLERRMDINGMKFENDKAFYKWLDDYNFIHDYNINIQPETYIDSIERY